MLSLKPFLRLSDGSRQEDLIKTPVKEKNGISAVYIDALARQPIDPDFGAGIRFKPDNVKSWMADYMYSEFWCAPAFGTDFKNLPDLTQGLIYQKTDGLFGVVLPVVSENYKCVLCAGEDGDIIAKLFTQYEGMSSCKALAFMWAEGENPYELLESCVCCALELLGRVCLPRKERRYPEIFEYLGWCSWDAFQTRVSEDKLLKKCQEFKDKKIPVKWAILDDMWAEVRDFYGRTYQNNDEMFRLMHHSKLYSFKADPIRFPGGLERCIRRMGEYGVTVGMWHPTTGYWMGIDPEGEIFKQYKDCLIRTPVGSYVPSYEEAKSYAFYNAFHDYLRKCGAKFVKIDNQSMSRRFYNRLAPVGDAARQFHNAMEASVGRHFDNAMINCMGMASEDMWNRSVSSISRCSNDFQPENREWFTHHIMQCSYNSLIQGQFYWCDWDMWWSDDGQAQKNSILRAISGGPIYVSDTAERSVREVLYPLALDDGRILRCDRPAMPTRDCITTDPTKSGNIFKLQNMAGDSGVVAVFNLSEGNTPTNGYISPSEVDGLAGDSFALYEHFSGEFKIMDYDEKLPLQLKDADDYRLYIIVPLKNGFGAIGRTDKFISPKTVAYVCDQKVGLVEDGPYAYVKDGKLYKEEK